MSKSPETGGSSTNRSTLVMPVKCGENSAGAKGARSIAVTKQLRNQQAAVKGLAIASIVAAVPLLFVGPLLLACIFWFAAVNFGYGLPFSWWFWGLTAIMVPAMFLGEARQRGGFFAGRNLDVSPGGLDGPALMPVPGDVGMLFNFVINPRLQASGFVELFLTGPRLMLDGLTKLRHAQQLRGVSLDRAGDAIVQLALFDKGVPIQSLLRGGETLDKSCRFYA